MRSLRKGFQVRIPAVTFLCNVSYTVFFSKLLLFKAFLYDFVYVIFHEYVFIQILGTSYSNTAIFLLRLNVPMKKLVELAAYSLQCK